MNIAVQVLPHGLGLELPQYQTKGAAGMDVRAAVLEPIILVPLQRAAIPTGIKMAIPKGYEVQVRPRSGLAFRNGISIPNSPGTIDSDYRGELKVLLINLGSEDFVVTRGMRIAQLVVAQVTQAQLHIVHSLDNTERGEGGFGSTGGK
jgi:dUTP pyrophosphatase